MVGDALVAALIITFPRAWTADQRLQFMADVARALPRGAGRTGDPMYTDGLDATAAERRAVFARLTKRRARKVDQRDVAILVWTA
jgi:hypothetical protein